MEDFILDDETHQQIDAILTDDEAGLLTYDDWHDIKQAWMEQ